MKKMKNTRPPARTAVWIANLVIVFGSLHVLRSAEGQASAPAASDSQPVKSVEIKRLMDESRTTPEGCIIEDFRIVSPSMNREIKALVVLPPEYKAHPEKKYPVLHTLHGARSPIDRFITKTPVLLQALTEKPMIVTCMDVDGLNRAKPVDAAVS